MRTARSSTITGVSVTEHPHLPGQRPPRTETPLDRDPPVDRQTLLKTLPSRNFVCGW